MSSSTAAASAATPLVPVLRRALRGAFAAFFATVFFFRTALVFAGAAAFEPGRFARARSAPAFSFAAALRGAGRFLASLTRFGITPRFHDDLAHRIRHEEARVASSADRSAQLARGDLELR